MFNLNDMEHSFCYIMNKRYYFKIVNKEYIENAHKNNIKVNVYTVNNVSKAKELLNWNVDGIITNYPKKMKKLWH